MNNGILNDIDFRYNGNGELEILEDEQPIYPDISDGSSGWRLDMIVKINSDGDLEIHDTTAYERWDADGYLGDNWVGRTRNRGEEPSWKFIVLERIISENSDEPELLDLVGVRQAQSYSALRHDGVYEVPGNGLYHYQKLIIPYKNDLLILPDQIYYDPDLNKIIHIDDGHKVAHGWHNVFDEEEVSDQFKKFDDFDELFNLIVDNQYNSCFYYSCDTFSMYDLVECFVLKEHARLKDMIANNCLGNCNNNSKNYDLDILLAAMIVIDNLIKKRNFFEAQRILDSLNTCGNLCKDVKNNLKGCGCGRN